MRRIRLNVTNEPTQIQGLYFFTQCMIELLFDHTNDSYKAPALNLVSRAFELEMMAEHVESSDINTETLRTFLEEFEWSLQIDPVLSKECKHRLLKGLQRVATGTPSPAKIKSFVGWARDDLSNYFADLKQLIVDTIGKPKEKALLRKLATSFAAHIELRGYSRRYAYHQVCRNLRRKLKFKNTKIDIEKTIVNFFKDFDGTDYDACVYFMGEKTFDSFEEIAKTWDISISNEYPSEISTHIDKFSSAVNNNLSTFIKITPIQKVKDRYTARNVAESMLKELIGMIKYHCHDKSFLYSDKAIVTTKLTPKGDQFTSRAPRVIIYSVGKNPNPTMNRFNDGTIDHVGINRLAELVGGKHLDPFSTRKFCNTLDYHLNALSAPGLENQLISLWSALEGLLPQPESGIRIKHFTEIVSNILVLSYPKKLFKEIARQLRDDLAPADIHLVEQIGFNRWIENVIALICCPKFTPQRDLILGKLDNHPLLRFRLKELFDGFSEVKSIKSTLENHKKKISWHINRIYMTRNMIVHSAESMPYLEIIVENLHDYLDSVIDTISYYAIKTTNRLSIDSLIEIIQTDYQIRTEHLSVSSNSKDAIKLDEENFLDFIHGRNNIIDLV